MRPQMAMSVVPLSYLELKTTCPFHFTSRRWTIANTYGPAAFANSNSTWSRPRRSFIGDHEAFIFLQHFHRVAVARIDGEIERTPIEHADFS
jgi:hypothetical protein